MYPLPRVRTGRAGLSAFPPPPEAAVLSFSTLRVWGLGPSRGAPRGGVPRTLGSLVFVPSAVSSQGSQVFLVGDRRADSLKNVFLYSQTRKSGPRRRVRNLVKDGSQPEM